MGINSPILPIENGGRFVVYASSYASLDSSCIDGGGTDDTQAIQAILDMAPVWGGLHLIIDGAALVQGIDVHSNTTIECENKVCGFFLASGANRSIIQNAHLDFQTRQDMNITLLGGTYNHNAAGQLHHLTIEADSGGAFAREKWVLAMEFYGVEYLTMRDVTIRNQRTFAMLIANWYRVTMENITIELPDNMYAQNQDGIHFWGPGQFLNIKNIMGGAGDDFIALAPDENDSVSDITDVLIDGVFLNDADQGIRMLSRGAGRLDRVTVRNVTGTFKSFGFFICPWFPGNGGNYGQITIENVDLRQANHKYEYYNPFLFRIGGNIEAITLRNISHHNPSGPLNLVDVGNPFYTPFDEASIAASHIGSLVIDGLQIYEKEGCAPDSEYIKLLGTVDSVVVRDTHINRSAAAGQQGSLISTDQNAHIGSLHVSGASVTGLNTLLNHSAGYIGTLCLHDVLAIGASGPLVVGDGEIGEFYTDGVHGAEL